MDNVRNLLDWVIEHVPENDTAKNSADPTLARIDRRLDELGGPISKLTTASELLAHQVKQMGRRLDKTDEVTADHTRRIDRMEWRHEVQSKTVAEVKKDTEAVAEHHDKLSEKVNSVWLLVTGISIGVSAVVGVIIWAFETFRGI